MLSDLRESILLIAKHFKISDAKKVRYICMNSRKCQNLNIIQCYKFKINLVIVRQLSIVSFEEIVFGTDIIDIKPCNIGQLEVEHRKHRKRTGKFHRNNDIRFLFTCYAVYILLYQIESKRKATQSLFFNCYHGILRPFFKYLSPKRT